MTLQHQMYDAVADVSADLHTLATSARARGLAVRRRRRALAAVGATAAALVAVGAVGGALALRPHASGPGFASSSPPVTGAAAPNIGRTTVAALAAAVDQVADGSVSHYAGQGSRSDDQSYGELLFAPASGGVAGLVEVNVQHLSIIGDGPYDCSASYLRDCKIRQLPDGDTLRTYTDLVSSSADGYRQLVAELLSPRRDLRVVVGATNTSSSDRHVVRPDPALTMAQLSEIATEPWWGFKLPAAYARAGQRLPSYNDVGATTTPSPSPSSS